MKWCRVSLNKTGVKGLFAVFRSGEKHDSFRVQIHTAASGNVWLSGKVDPRLKQINDYLRYKCLRKDAAEKDSDFLTMKHRLFADLQQEYSLAHYRGREKILLETKEFNFEDSMKKFVQFKSDTSVPKKHESILKNVWLPFYLEKGCKHPTEFHQWRKQALMHVKTTKKVDSDERYSSNTWTSLTTTHNEYMRFLLDNGDIQDKHFFTILATITTEQRKRGLTSKSRKFDTYSEQEVIEIKAKIDATYANNLHMKVRAYALYLGVCTGLRKGNLIGLTGENLHPDDPMPHIETNDNIVSGWSRGIPGTVVLENSTKTFVGTIKLPLIQPSPEIARDVCAFLKANIAAGNRILECHPRTVATWWKEIAKECGFKYLMPHDWKHSYATIGSLHFQDWYKGNPYFLQACCLHEKIETTMRYVKQKADQFLAAFYKA